MGQTILDQTRLYSLTWKQMPKGASILKYILELFKTEVDLSLYLQF